MNYLEYLPIFVFVIIAVGLSAGFALLSGFVGPSNPDKENFLPMNVVFHLLMMLEVDLMLDSI